MPARQFTANFEWNTGVEAQCHVGYRTLTYSGNLNGGTLQVFTQIADGGKVAVADAKLSAATVDGNGDMIRQFTFQSSGTIWVHLTGATAPTALVAVQ